MTDSKGHTLYDYLYEMSSRSNAETENGLMVARGWEEGVQKGEEMLFILGLETVGVGQRKKVQEASFQSHLLG